MTPTIDLVYFNAGGGHRAAALALQAAIAQQQRPWNVRLMNLFEVLDSRGRFRQLFGAPPEDLYNKRLARGWTYGLAQELKLLQAGIRLAHASLVDRLQLHWAATEPDLVVSLVPNFNRAMRESLAAALPGVPYATVMTDMADLPPAFWIEPGPNQVVVCGSERAHAQAREAGLGVEQLRLTSGMPLRPAFYEPPRTDRASGLRALGLDPSRPTAAVMFGGQGSMQMLRIARRLGELQLIALCGHNAALVEALNAKRDAGRDAAPRAAIGFTADVAHYLRLADFFIGKPGPGCLSEAVHCGLPVLTVLDRSTMPQERWNAQWVRDKGVGVVVGSLRQLGHGVREVIADFEALREHTRQVDNRAVWELCDIVAELLALSGTTSGRLDMRAPDPARQADAVT
jgi:UDP-N-acetylglucosamine:LPS N-acetylglucosamine transferase